MFQNGLPIDRQEARWLIQLIVGLDRRTLLHGEICVATLSSLMFQLFTRAHTNMRTNTKQTHIHTHTPNKRTFCLPRLHAPSYCKPHTLISEAPLANSKKSTSWPQASYDYIPNVFGRFSMLRKRNAAWRFSMTTPCAMDKVQNQVRKKVITHYKPHQE